MFCIQKQRTAHCTHTQDILPWAGTSRGRGRRNTCLFYYHLLPNPTDFWVNLSHQIQLCWDLVEKSIAIHQVWLFQGFPTTSSPSPASFCSLWLTGCHQGRLAVSQHWLTAIAANAPLEVLLLLGWVSLLLIIESIIDGVSCHCIYMATVLHGEQIPWRSFNQQPENQQNAGPLSLITTIWHSLQQQATCLLLHPYASHIVSAMISRIKACIC